MARIRDISAAYQSFQSGKAIIVISSELPEVMRLSHRIAVMCEGRLTVILPGGAAATGQEDIMRLATLRESMVVETDTEMQRRVG